MSGDVQPRKRKDKRRKKADGEYTIQRIRGASCDEDDAGTPPPTLVNPSENVENVAIHVHKESSTGGHWCARIIFFTLAAILIGLIGIIIFEYRGATDVDTPVASSQWAMIFDGWVDDVSFLHNEEHGDQEAQSGEHEEDEDYKSEGDEDHDEGLGDEEGSHEEDQDGEEGEDEENDESDTDNADSVEDDEVDYEESREKEAFNSPEEGEMLDNSEENQELDNDEGFEDNSEETDKLGVLEEFEDSSGEENSNDNEEEFSNDPEVELDHSLEGVKASEENYDDQASDEFFEIPGVSEIDNSDGPLEEVDEEEPEEVLDDVVEEEEKDEVEEEEPSSVAVKFGVGVALVVAAHFVLVRRWNNGEPETPENRIGIEELPDLSRRNTIVSPPHLKEISTKQSTQEAPSKKQTQNYEDLRAKYKTLGSDEALDKIAMKKVVDLQAEKLRSKEELNMQSEAKSASEEEDYTETSEGELITDSEDLEDEEEVEDEEVEDEEEEDDDEDLEEIDDSELVAKLEAKYGKLPTPTESEGDDEEEEDDGNEEDDDDEEEEEEDDEDIKGWKHVTASKEAEAGAKRKAQMGLDTKFSSTGVPKMSSIANVSTAADSTTSEELRNPHLQGPHN